MAITRTGAWWTGTNKSTSTLINSTTTTAAAAGDWLIAVCATDNSFAGFPNATAPLIFLDPDLGTQEQFSLAIAHEQTPGFVNDDGVVVSVHYLKCAFSHSIGSGIRIVYQSTTPTAKAWSIDRFASSTNANIAIVGSPATSNGATSTPTVTKSITSGNLAIGAVAWETSSTTLTQDTDTTNGTFVAFTHVGTSGGGAATNVRVTGSSKIVTATGNQTYNPTISAVDNAIVLVEFTEQAPPPPGDRRRRFYYRSPQQLYRAVR